MNDNKFYHIVLFFKKALKDNPVYYKRNRVSARACDEMVDCRQCCRVAPARHACVCVTVRYEDEKLAFD